MQDFHTILPVGVALGMRQQKRDFGRPGNIRGVIGQYALDEDIAHRKVEGGVPGKQTGIDGPDVVGVDDGFDLKAGRRRPHNMGGGSGQPAPPP